MCSLVRKGDFKSCFDNGFRTSSPSLVVYVRPNGLPFSRLGLSVGRKIGTAVVRNRVKRRLREAVRKILEEHPSTYDLVIVARSAALTAPFDELVRIITRGLARKAHEKRTARDHTAL